MSPYGIDRRLCIDGASDRQAVSQSGLGNGWMGGRRKEAASGAGRGLSVLSVIRRVRRLPVVRAAQRGAWCAGLGVGQLWFRYHG